jgi:hypothetical protein
MEDRPDGQSRETSVYQIIGILSTWPDVKKGRARGMGPARPLWVAEQTCYRPPG